MAGIVKIVIEPARDTYRGGYEVNLIDAADGVDEELYPNLREARKYANHVARASGLEQIGAREWGSLLPTA